VAEEQELEHRFSLEGTEVYVFVESEGWRRLNNILNTLSLSLKISSN
jgi:hypothetical protein